MRAHLLPEDRALRLANQRSVSVLLPRVFEQAHPLRHLSLPLFHTTSRSDGYPLITVVLLLSSL